MCCYKPLSNPNLCAVWKVFKFRLYSKKVRFAGLLVFPGRGQPFLTCASWVCSVAMWWSWLLLLDVLSFVGMTVRDGKCSGMVGSYLIKVFQWRKRYFNMWFDSLQIFGSRWGPYCNKIPSSWEVSWRWCPDAVYWSWFLEHHLWPYSGSLLSPCNCPREKPQEVGKGKQCSYTSVPQLFTALCPNAFIYCFSSQKAANPRAPWSCSCWPHSGHHKRSRMSRKGNTPWNRMGQNQNLTFCHDAVNSTFHPSKPTFPGSAGAGLESRPGLLKVEPLS